MRWKGLLVVLCGVALLGSGCWGVHRRVALAKAAQAKAEAAALAESEARLAMNYLQLADPAAGSLVKPEHYIRNWLILGPFPFEADKYGGEEGGQGAAKIAWVPNEANLVAEEGAEVAGKTWKRYKNESSEATPERIDLDQFFGAPEYAAAYAACVVCAPSDLNNLTLRTGSDDFLTVWVNGKELFRYDERRRAASPDQDEIKGIALKKGRNIILLKVTDVVFDWEFYARFCDADGNPMRVTDKP